MLNNILDKENRKIWMGISIVWIYLYHIVLFGQDKSGGGLSWTIITYIFDSGYIGVDIFMFLSAYGLCYSFRNYSLITFYKRRFKRLFPLYLIFLITLSIFFYKFDFELLKNWLLQCTGLSVICKFNCELEWFTPSLILIYLSFPFFYNLVAFLYRKCPLLVIYIIVSIIAIISPKLGSYIYIDFSRRLPIIILGILTFLFITDKKEKDLIILFTLMIISSFIIKEILVSNSLCVPILLLGLNYVKLSKYIVNPFKIIGKYTFEIYLAQVIAIRYFIKGPSVQNIYLAFLFSTIITLILTVLFYQLNNLPTRLFVFLKGQTKN